MRTRWQREKEKGGDRSEEGGRGRVSHREFDGRYFHISHYSLGWELREGAKRPGAGEMEWKGRENNQTPSDLMCPVVGMWSAHVLSVCAWQGEKEGERVRESECESTCAWCVEGQEFREPDESKGRWTQTNCVCVSVTVCVTMWLPGLANPERLRAEVPLIWVREILNRHWYPSLSSTHTAF